MKALEIDESLPEAQSAALGLVRALFDWDWAGADRAFRRAVELNPNSPDADTGYLIYLIPMGRFQEGMADAKRGRPSRPRRLRGASASARCTSFRAERTRRSALFREALEFDPDLGVRSAGGRAGLLGKGMYEEAIAEYRKELGDGPRYLPVVGHRGNAYARAGREVRGGLRECLRELKQRSKSCGREYGVVFIHAGLGEKGTKPPSGRKGRRRTRPGDALPQGRSASTTCAPTPASTTSCAV